MRQMFLSLTAMVVLTLSACGTTSQRESTGTAQLPLTDSTSVRDSSRVGSQPAAAAERQRPSDISLLKVSAGQTSPETAGVERKIIRNAELTVESQNPEESFRKVASLAESKGGFVVTSEATQPEGAAEPGRTTVSVVVRVPAAQFEATVEEIRKVGDRVLQDKRSGQDVTEEFIDLQARLQAKKALEAQYLEIMKQAQKVSEALEVQRELAEVRGEVEQIEGRRRFLESQSSLSTIKVTIMPPVHILGAKGGFKEALRDGVGAATAIIFVLLRVVIVSLPLLLLIGLPSWFIARYWIRRSKRAKLS